MSAWTKVAPLARKLEMKRRAAARKRNRAARLIELAARDLLASTPSSALAFPKGLK